MAQAIQVDTLRLDQVAPRLRQLGAQESPQHNKNNQRYFYSQSYDVWIVLKGGRSGTYILEYYKGCPCGA